MTQIVVVGCASLDTIHVERDGNQLTHESPGGAALYTALAACGSGIKVTLVAPKPDPLPDVFRQIAENLNWLGPKCTPSQIPKLEIVHHGNSKATLISASWGAESMLLPEYMPTLRAGDIVHIAALSSAQAQKAFLKNTRRTEDAIVSIGTYFRLVQSSKEEIRSLLNSSNFFFMNSNECDALFPEGKVNVEGNTTKVFVTDGANGATIYDGKAKYEVPATSAVELDPTGAGDTFCGVTLGELARGVALVDAAKIGCAVASQSIEQIGPNIIMQRLAR